MNLYHARLSTGATFDFRADLGTKGAPITVNFGDEHGWQTTPHNTTGTQYARAVGLLLAEYLCPLEGESGVRVVGVMRLG